MEEESRSINPNEEQKYKKKKEKEVPEKISNLQHML